MRSLGRLFLGIASLAGASALADPAAVAVSAPELPARNYANMRIGPSSSSSRPQLCLEVSPIDLIGLEACGTGSGFLHKDPAPEIAHFRTKVKLATWKTEIGWVQPRIGLGFAELQIGEDASGFDFGGTGPTGVETAGPELGAFSHAPRLLNPQPALQPSVSFTLGFGF
jgi:hypothetical protein